MVGWESRDGCVAWHSAPHHAHGESDSNGWGPQLNLEVGGVAPGGGAPHPWFVHIRSSTPQAPWRSGNFWMMPHTTTGRSPHV